ncbi:hypothetical protein [Salinibacterium sp. ZJ450]|uniref:hypothetical protein n=1 Tax=Salinibacterium sp. ZJ450 TaxID=2708338 RepID=UPI001424024B|nr:hypothetical protein [Salinibacterium sp. ZJ450]
MSKRTWVYVIAVLVLVVLALWVVLSLSAARQNLPATENAHGLVQVLEDAGATSTPALSRAPAE